MCIRLESHALGLCDAAAGLIDMEKSLEEIAMAMERVLLTGRSKTRNETKRNETKR